MLTSRTARWTVGTALLCVALLAVTWLLLVSPRRDEATELRDANLAAQNQNDLLEVKIAQLRAQFAKLPEKQAELADILAQMPADAGMPRLVRDLDTMAQTTGATLTSVTPGAAQALVSDPARAAQAAPAAPAGDAAAAAPATETSAVVEIPVTVVIEGDYFQTVAFLKRLQKQMPRAFLVTTVQMSAGSGGSDAAAGSTGQVQVTIGGSVFALPGMSADTVATGEGATTGATGATSPMGSATPPPTATPAPSGQASPAATPSPSASTSLETT
jgi:Tfp pilus assembly protein PilO